MPGALARDAHGDECAPRLEVDQPFRSLAGVAGPLATEPNSLIFDAPWAFATRRISDLCERSMVKLGAFGSVAVARCALMLTRC